MEAANELCRRTQECLSLFQDAAEHQNLADDDWLEDRAADFAWWAHGLKAQKSSRSSLDYRLRERLDIKIVIAGLLDSLALALREYLQPDIDEEPESSHDAPDDEACESDKSSTDSSWSDFSDEVKQPKYKDAATDTPDTEDSDPKFYIETNLKLLAKISVAIRRSGAKLRYLKADAYLKDHFDDDEYTQLREHLLLLILVGPYEQRLLGELRRLALNKEIPTAVEIVIRSWMVDPSRAKPNQQRLIEANITRRNRIAYSKRFIGKNAPPKKGHGETAPTVAPSQFPEALLRPAKEPSTFGADAQEPFSIPGPIQLPPTPLEPVESLTAKTLTATELGSHFVLPVIVPLEPKKGAMSIATKITKTGIKQDYPACPAKKGTFQCPYCVQVLTEDYTAKSRWRGHVAQDLNPYSCIYQDCPDSHKLYATKEEWTKHMQAQHNEERWACDDCIFESEQVDEFIFESQELWENHMRSRHSRPDDRLKLLCSISKRVLTQLAECPLCIRPCGHSRPDQDNHISEHLHSWALRALPWDLNPDDEVSSDSPEMGSENDLARMSDISQQTEDDVDKTATISDEFDREVTCWRSEILDSSSRLYDLMGGLEDMIGKWTARKRLDMQNEIALQHLININQARAQFLRASDAGLEAHEFTPQQQQDIETNLGTNIELAIEFMKGIVDEEGAEVIRIIPYPRNEDLVHRRDLIDKLDNLLPQTTSGSYSAALWGLGGSGKTQIALDYAYRQCDADDECSVFWVHADSEAAFLADYKTIGEKLGVDERLDGPDLLDAVRHAIEGRSKWLMILDNADDLRLFGVGRQATTEETNEHQSQSLYKYVPWTSQRTVLWTSRDAHVAGTLVGVNRGIEVRSMAMDEAATLLAIARGDASASEQAAVDAILGELQCLPLAISQAGAYMRRMSMTAEQYLDLLRQGKARWEVLKVSDADRHRRPEVSNSVLETWGISTARIRVESEMSYQMLHVIAYVDSQDIPQDLLAAAAYLDHGDDGDDKDSIRQVSELEVLTAIARLKEFSFLSLRQTDDGIRRYEMHKPVQEALRYGLKMGRPVEATSRKAPGVDDEPQESEAYYCGRALEVVDHLFTSSERTSWERCEQYVTHAVRVGEWAE
ncbi:hypothetical protein FCOIX_13806, partial [Fusarium coicis]